MGPTTTIRDLPETDREYLGGIEEPEARQSTEALLSQAMSVAREVADETGVPFASIIGRSRHPHVVRARHRTWTRLRYEMGWSTKLIGQVFHRDHTTIVHGTRRVLSGIRVATE